MYSSFLGALFSSRCCRRDLGSSLSAIYTLLDPSPMIIPDGDAYWARNFCVDLGEVDKGLVEVLDSFGSVLRRLVADIANAAMREELDIRDGEPGEVLAHIVLCELGWQPAHKNA